MDYDNNLEIEGDVLNVNNVSVDPNEYNEINEDDFNEFSPVSTVEVQRWFNNHPVELDVLGQGSDESEKRNKLIARQPSEELNKQKEEFESDGEQQLPIDNVTGNADASEASDMTELEAGDDEILIHRQKRAPPTDSIVKENFECDRDFMYVMYEGMCKQFKSTQDLLKNEVGAIKSEMKSSMKILRTEVQKEIEIKIKHVETSMSDKIVLMQNEVQQVVKENNNKLLAQTKDMATGLMSVVDSVKGSVQSLTQSIDTFKEDCDEMQADMTLLKGTVLTELESQFREITITNNRVDEVDQELRESKVELKALNANTDIQVKVLQAKVEVMTESVDQLKVVLADYQNKVRDLKGAVEANVARENVMNGHIHAIKGKVDELGVVVPTIVRECLEQSINAYRTELWRNDRPNSNSLPTPPPEPERPPAPVAQSRVDNLPSISSSPLLPPNYVTPSPPWIPSSPRARTSRSDHVIADIVKREQKPSFSGDNISPPMFLQEVERFFDLIQVTEERDRLQLFSTFLTDNPFEWWKLISHQITTWGMAKSAFLAQYFNDYERQRYKADWQQLECKNFASVEEFVLKGLTILNTVKPNDSDQKKWEKITVKLPEPLRDYLLNKQFLSTPHFFNCIKEAMRLKNFNANLYFKNIQINRNASRGNYSFQPDQNNNLNYNHQNNDLNSNNYNNNQNNSNFRFQRMNPRFKGNSQNYNPNYRYNANTGNNVGNSSSNSGNSYRTPPNSPPRGRNSGNTFGNTTPNRNGNNRQGNNSRTNYVGAAGTTKPRRGVNQVRWAQSTSQSPAGTTPSSPTSPIPPTSPINHFHFTFPAGLFSSQKPADRAETSTNSTYYDTMGTFSDGVNGETDE